MNLRVNRERRAIERVLAFDNTMIGSDGLPHDVHPHPRLWGTFPRVLGHYCREIGLFGLETAVHKMTGLPASRFGLTGRGTVAEGAYADLTVFDPETVIDRATFAEPALPSDGFVYVLVAGQAVIRKGLHARTPQTLPFAYAGVDFGPMPCGLAAWISVYGAG